MYDYTHPISDALEGITHSICTLEFEDHRPFYDWVLDNLPVPCHPQQIEFARLNLSYTVMSKRKLLELVDKAHVRGWDDPRLPTIAGLRRRGFTPESIRNFAELIGVAKRESMVDMALLEHCLREDLNKRARRVMAVLRPLKVVISNYPEGQVEELDAENNPEDPDAGTRKLPFSREIYIEQDDFREDPPKKFFRLSPGKEIRLKHAYYIRCDEVIKDSQWMHHRAALQLRSRIARRLDQGRPQGAGHLALGVGRPRRRGRGASVRQAAVRGRPGRREGRKGFQGIPQSQLAGDPERLQGRTGFDCGPSGRVFPVPAPGLFLPGQRFVRGTTGLQPLRQPARFLDQDRKITTEQIDFSAVRRTME